MVSIPPAGVRSIGSVEKGDQNSDQKTSEMARDWPSEKYHSRCHEGTIDDRRGSAFQDAYSSRRRQGVRRLCCTRTGIFESASVKDAPSVILSLMNDQPSQPSQQDQFDPILGSRLDDLLKTCVPGISPLKEELRKNRLRVCMRTLWYFARQYEMSQNTTPLPSYVRAVFASPEMSRQIQSEEDIAARLITRSFNSLIVKRLTQDIDSHITQGSHASVEELSCIASILDKPSVEVADLLRHPGAIGLANFVSLTSSETGTIVEGRVPSEVLRIFRMTLDILLADLQAYPNADLPPDLVAIFHKTYSDAEQLPVPDWLMDRLRQVLEVLSVVRDEPEVPRVRNEPKVPSLALPRPEPGSPTNTSNIVLQPGDGSESPLLGNRILATL